MVVTRINLVRPQELYDQHLFAEFREIKMVPKSLARSIAAAERRNVADPVGWVLARIPKAFTLNTGHVSFFYDKGLYLTVRYARLCDELARRGFNFDKLARFDPDGVYERDGRLFGGYIPTPEAIDIIEARIAEKVALKPHWYRYTGERL
jgi:deoxyribonuclease (pyrimidine dimer)